MSDVLRFVFVLPFAFVAASFAAGFALVWPFIDMPAGLSASDLAIALPVAFAVLVQSAQVGAAALVPWALFALVTELLGWRSILLHAGAGVAGGAVALRLLPGGADAGDDALRPAFLAAGLAFALAHWLLAGRSAGRWRRARLPPDSAAKPEEEPRP